MVAAAIAELQSCMVLAIVAGKLLLQQNRHHAMKNSSSWTEIHQRKLHA